MGCASCGNKYRPRPPQTQQKKSGGSSPIVTTPITPQQTVVNTPDGGYPVGGYRTKK